MNVASRVLLVCLAVVTGCASGTASQPVFGDDGVSSLAANHRPLLAGCSYSNTDFADHDYDIWADCQGFDMLEHRYYFQPYVQDAVLKDIEGRFESQTRAEDSSDTRTLAGESATRVQVTYTNADSGPHRTLVYYFAGQDFYACDVDRWTEPGEDYRLRTEAEFGPELKNCDAAIEALHTVVRTRRNP